MPPHPNAVRLRDLVRLAEPVELPSRRLAKVAPFSFRMREMARQIDAMEPGEQQDAAVLALVRLCVPDMTDAEAADLTPTEALAITGISAGTLDAVLTAYREANAEAEPEPGEAAAAASAGAEGNGEPAAADDAPPALPSPPPSPSPTISSI